MTLTALPWIGGKSSGAGNTQHTGEWVASLLPVDRKVVYIEPFAGMLGVLLARPVSSLEIANDLDGRVVNWWRVVREEPAELTRLIALTPHSRDEFEAAWERVKERPDATGVRAALDFTIAIAQNITKGTARGQWAATYSVDVGSVSYFAVAKRIAALAERICEVQLENRPAEEILERTARERRAVVYADPPYKYAADPGDTYRRFSYDEGKLTDVLLAQQGRVAVSGYGDEWDHLGWERHEHIVKASSVGGDEARVSRTEVLWTNFEPPQRRLL